MLTGSSSGFYLNYKTFRTVAFLSIFFLLSIFSLLLLLPEQASAVDQCVSSGKTYSVHYEWGVGTNLGASDARAVNMPSEGITIKATNCQAVGQVCYADGACGLPTPNTPTNKVTGDPTFRFVGWYDIDDKGNLSDTQITNDSKFLDIAQDASWTGPLHTTPSQFNFGAKWESVIAQAEDTSAPQIGDITIQVHTVFMTAKSGTYGPISIDLIDMNDSSSPVIAKQSTDTLDLSKSPDATLVVKFAGQNVGDYRACLSNDNTICAGSDPYIFHNDATLGVTKTIELTEDQAKAFIMTDGSSTTCAIPGLGWIVCPVVNFMAWIADSAFNFIEKTYLETKTQIFNTSDVNGQKTYQTWSNMRNVANVVFVIAFLVIILSQITGFGVDNYGIKKMLPRLILTALLVNVSYYACQIAIDLSNIVGNSISGVLSNMASSSSGNTSDFWATGNGFTDVAGGILAVAVAGTAAWVALAALVPVLISAVLSLLMIFLMLVARQALVVILVIIAPIAFIAFLLPNTQKLFQKWSKALGALLLLYPIIAFVFGASKWISSVMREVYAADANGIGGVIAAAVLVLPLFVVPMILKKSLDGIGGIGETVNGLRDKLNGKLGQSWSNSGMKDLMKARSENKIMNSTRTNPFITARRGFMRMGLRRKAVLSNQQRESELSRTSYIAEQTQSNEAFRNKMIKGAGAGAESRAIAGAVSAQGSLVTKEMDAERVLLKNMKVKNVDGTERLLTSGEVESRIYNTDLTDLQRSVAAETVMQTGTYDQRKRLLENSNGLGDRARAVVREEYYKKGDQQFFGGKLGDKITLGEKLDLDKEMQDVIKSKKVNPTTLIQDASATADFVRNAKVLGDEHERGVVEQAKEALDLAGTRAGVSTAIKEELEKLRGNSQLPGQTVISYGDTNPNDGDMNIPH